MTSHGALSVVVNIKPRQEQLLIDTFKQMEKVEVDTNHLVPFRLITTIHFARFVVLQKDEDAKGHAIPARLVFTTNYDLPLENHLQQLVQIAGEGLWQIFSSCEYFPASSYNPESLYGYLQANNQQTETFYVGRGNRSVDQVEKENELRTAIETFIDQEEHSLKGEKPGVVRNKIIEFVSKRPDLAWATTPDPAPSMGWMTSFYGKMIGVILLTLLFSPLILLLVIVWMLIMLVHELREADEPDPVTKEHARELIARETGVVQTQFSALGNIKPGKFRLLTMLFLLRMTNFLAPYLFSKGKLSGIPTVHFARWLIINDGKQMLFLSNFDGNSEGYLRDFIHIAAKQLTLMFCHTVGYPKTRLMVFGGAKDAKGFMDWARNKQIVTNIWYSANKDVTVSNIFHNSKVRDGLYKEMNEAEACKWLQLF
jgi:uncharacterized membrane protein